MKQAARPAAARSAESVMEGREQREANVGHGLQLEAADCRRGSRSQFAEDGCLGFVVDGLVLPDVDADAQLAARQVAVVYLEILPPALPLTLAWTHN